MIFGKLRWISKEQRGFTLIEVLATVIITGLIGFGAAAATVQVLTQGTRNSDYTAASRHAMNAIHWISRDAQMAQTVEPNGATGFPLTLGWIDWDNSEYEVTYSIDDDKLTRSYSVNSTVTEESVVAQYINSVSGNTTCEFSDRVLTLTVTATAGDNDLASSVTKKREIIPRPKL